MASYNLQVGEVYSRLTVLEKLEIGKSDGRSKWLFKCNCGNEKTTTGRSVCVGATTSCGCFQKERSASKETLASKIPTQIETSKSLHLGKKYNNLTVIDVLPPNLEIAKVGLIFKCLCDCGTVKEILGSSVTRPNNATKTCGCGRANSISTLLKGGKDQAIQQRLAQGMDPDVAMTPSTILERQLFAKSLGSDTKSMDNHSCILCGKRGGVLASHHIFGWARDKALRFVEANIVTLCQKCHHEDVHLGNTRVDTSEEVKNILLEKLIDLYLTGQRSTAQPTP